MEVQREFIVCRQGGGPTLRKCRTRILRTLLIIIKTGDQREQDNM
jgi:hypothetical protein